MGFMKTVKQMADKKAQGRLEAPVDWHQPFPNLHLCPICLAASQDIASPNSPTPTPYPQPRAWEMPLESRMLS